MELEMAKKSLKTLVDKFPQKRFGGITGYYGPRPSTFEEFGNRYEKFTMNLIGLNNRCGMKIS